MRIKTYYCDKKNHRRKSQTSERWSLKLIILTVSLKKKQKIPA